MTASRPSSGRGCALAALLAAAWLVACTTPAPPVSRSPVQPLPGLAAHLPDAADHAAHQVAAAVLIDHVRSAESGRVLLEALDASRVSRDELPTGLVPYAQEALHACLDDPVAYRRATGELLDRDDLPETLRARLRQAEADDPLRLADQRLRDARQARLGRIFNALVEPVGRSIASLTFLPVRLSQSLLGLALAEHAEDELPLFERQALGQWKRFIEENPGSEQSEALLDRVQAAQLRWLETRRDKSLARARRALERRDPLLATVLAQRALRYAPEDPEGLELLRRAEREGAAWRKRRAESLAVAANPEVVSPRQRPLALALLDPHGDPAAAARALQQTAPAGTLEGEAAFALALAQPDEDAAWKALAQLAGARGPDGTPLAMARHAGTLLASPSQNPYGAFRASRGDALRERLRWLAFGPLAHGARDRDLPRSVEWLVELPAMVGVGLGLPNRLIRLPFVEARARRPAAMARRYLERFPAGAHADEVRAWLEDYEEDRGNWVGALRLAEGASEPGDGALARLRERAGEQALETSRKERRRDVRHLLLRQVAQRFRDTEAGKRAGEALREELLHPGSQHIRISREFLKENPRVAGPRGLALRPELLDGAARNGELHAEGVTLLGGRVVEFAFLGERGRDADPPQRVRRRLSEERLARLVAELDEAAREMALTDPDVSLDPDAARDLYFERARLGAADRPDPRAAAESNYAFLGAREKYGLVRSRESILPVEIVLQGSFQDFGLGAFPRIRMPRRTPDAFLYRD